MWSGTDARKHISCCRQPLHLSSCFLLEQLFPHSAWSSYLFWFQILLLSEVFSREIRCFRSFSKVLFSNHCSLPIKSFDLSLISCIPHPQESLNTMSILSWHWPCFIFGLGTTRFYCNLTKPLSSLETWRVRMLIWPFHGKCPGFPWSNLWKKKLFPALSQSRVCQRACCA